MPSRNWATFRFSRVPLENGATFRFRALCVAICLAGLVFASPQGRTGAQNGATLVDGGIVRGQRATRRLALEFTGHEFAEGADTILDTLKRRHARASFFLTGDFLRRPEFRRVILRIRDEGHYLGPHSDRHLLYCDWSTAKTRLVSREAFDRDVRDNLAELSRLGIDTARVGFWVPPYEQYNPEICRWSLDSGLQIVNYTPGTRSNADYTGEADSNFVPSAEIVRRILAHERDDADGLNGFLLLMHIGAGPGRRDKMHDHLDALMDQLVARGYSFVRVDELLGGGSR
jgi:peptidoglycan/xylan/chitin deacetylase (PgdA/CDA1 family)